MARVLVVDGDRLIRLSLKQRLEQEGHEVAQASQANEAIEQFDHGVDLVLLDLQLPGCRAKTLLSELLAADPDVPIVAMTSNADVTHAVEVMRAGANNYLVKPFSMDQVVLVAGRALRDARAERRMRALQEECPGSVESIISQSEVMDRCKQLLTKVAASPSSTVLLTGESGTGKDLAAHGIHEASSRREGPFLNITCSAIASELLESELFGHERGAFTDAKERKHGLLEQAHTGTVFLDEVGEMQGEMQAKLLRFLEEKAFRRVGGSADIRTDVRVIAATNVDLRQAVKQGLFREDLYYRLAVLEVPLPPLRQREGDIPLLVEHFITIFNREFNKRVQGVSPAALNRLVVYSWPGNVRELRNAVERAVLLADTPQLEEDDFPGLKLAPPPEDANDFALPPSGVDLRRLEEHLVRQALDRAKGNRTLAGSLLGMNRDQIRYRIEKFDIEEHMN